MTLFIKYGIEMEPNRVFLNYKNNKQMYQIFK